MEKQTIPYENLVSIKEYANIAGVTPKTVYDWEKKGDIHFYYYLNSDCVDKRVPPPYRYKSRKRLMQQRNS